MGLAQLVRSFGTISWTDYQRLYEKFAYQGIQYVLPSGSMQKLTALQGMADPIVMACITFRMSVFSEISFQYQQFPQGKKLFGTKSLAILENPWTQAHTRDLLATMEVDASLYGNSYWRPVNGQLVWLDPIQMRIITGDAIDNLTGNPIGKVLVGYAVVSKTGKDVAIFAPNEIVHYKPIPDPENPFRGLSWLSAILPDVSADIDMTQFKISFLRNAATPQLAVVFSEDADEEAIGKFRDRLEAFHTSPDNAFKTLYVGSGADVKSIGANFSEMTFSEVQSQGETRIAAAASVPPSLVGIAEGLKGSSLNAGNYIAVRRRFADGTMRTLWRSACGALESVAPPPAGARLWYVTDDVPFLQLDADQAAAIRAKDSTAFLNLANAGFKPETIVQAILLNDWSVLEWSGLPTVQLQPALDPADPPAATTEEQEDE